MSLQEKLEEIRRQPQNIKLRWVLAAVSVCMFFIFIIWLFSLQMLFKKEALDFNGNNSFESIKAKLENINKDKPSIEALNEGLENIDADNSN